jgi:GMP synthase-like glutamine amidotransferase
MGRMVYDWVGPAPLKPEAGATLHLLASHQDQVLTLPVGATLQARSDFCPIAAYSIDDRVFCVQPHPEFVADYSAYLLDKRKEAVGAERHAKARADLWLAQDGLDVARFMQRFVEGPLRA